jgi:hypothetical protein
MNAKTLNDFKHSRRNLELIARIDKPHEVLNYDRPIEVYYEDIIYDGNKTRFYLFDNGKYVGNPIDFPCEIEYGDIREIGQDMINELLQSSDFHDLDLELEGKAPCHEYRNKYSKCDYCELYTYGKGKDRHDGCLGAMYSIPTHINSWEKTEEKWNKVYGEGSIEHQNYITKQMIRHIQYFMSVCGHDKNAIEKVLNHGKNHWKNKHPKLFK